MVTMKDIACEAGVSRPTVSLVLNNKATQIRISETTSKKVLAAAERLGYCRNDLAIAVKTGKTNVIAFISFNIGTWEYVGEIMSGILAETTRAGYSLKVYDSSNENSENLLKRLLQQRVTGVIFHELRAGHFAEMQRQLSQCGVYCAIVNLSNDISGIGVTSDDFDGMKAAVKHLVEQGHKHITYISRKSNAAYVKIREDGFGAGMQEYLPNASSNIQYVPDAGIDGNVEPLKVLLSLPEQQRPSALLCFTDYVAVAAMQAAYMLNIRIPEQLMVIGFGGLDFSKNSVIPLTTIAQPFEEMGYKTVEKLIDAIKTDRKEMLKSTENISLPTELIIRKSTSKRN